MTANPYPGEFWLTRGGETVYVERYDRYLLRLIVIDKDGCEMLRDEKGRALCNVETDGDLVEHLPSCSSFKFYKERVGPHK
jgi:hypothetical protein